MTPQELRDDLARLKMSQLELARLTGINERTVRRWCDARTNQRLTPGAVALIGLALAVRRRKLAGQRSALTRMLSKDAAQAEH
jgi:transcriptional regulator with XRE-family HTH domain